MIEWLTININPPKLDTEIIVKSTVKPTYGYKGIYCELKFFNSSFYTQESMMNELSYEKWDLWSDVK